MPGFVPTDRSPGTMRQDKTRKYNHIWIWRGSLETNGKVWEQQGLLQNDPQREHAMPPQICKSPRRHPPYREPPRARGIFQTTTCPKVQESQCFRHAGSRPHFPQCIKSIGHSGWLHISRIHISRIASFATSIHRLLAHKSPSFHGPTDLSVYQGLDLSAGHFEQLSHGVVSSVEWTWPWLGFDQFNFLWYLKDLYRVWYSQNGYKKSGCNLKKFLRWHCTVATETFSLDPCQWLDRKV